MKRINKLNTYYRLGLKNVSRVACYRLGLKFGVHPVQKISANLLGGDFFLPPDLSSSEFEVIKRLPRNKSWDNQYLFFGWYAVKADNGLPPNWFKNYFSDGVFQNTNKHWWQISDFDPAIGDIKCIWEASRFDWVVTFAQQVAQGDAVVLDKLNAWLTDWVEKNPAYLGANWKCGQEASIRVMHLALAAYLMRQHDELSEPFTVLLKAHLQRIAPTMSYALGQDNNHGTSEAAALFVGGSLLKENGVPEGSKWERQGRKWLEERALRLIEQDGSFSQYSLNYHRVMLDTYSFAERWRRLLKREEFSSGLYERLKAATTWLHVMTDPETGDGPNLGANDGARLFPLTETDYRDYRPSVQLASLLFKGKSAYQADGDYNLPAQWLKIDIAEEVVVLKNQYWFKDGGYVVLRKAATRVILRYPNFRFRPSQSDALHLDVWHNGNNVLRDGGSYSYNISEAVSRYYGGVESHNTIQFGQNDQMPKLSRFLYGAWLMVDSLEVQDNKIYVGYSDQHGNCHLRLIKLVTEHLCEVSDEVHLVDEKQPAILRWRLLPKTQQSFKLQNNVATSSAIEIAITSEANIDLELRAGKESRYYYLESVLPVLEIKTHHNAKICSQIKLKV